MILLNQIDAHKTPADRFRDSRAKESEGDKVEGRRPHHSITGGQDPGRNYGGDRIRGVVKAVREIKDECDQNDEKDKNDGRIDLRHGFSWLDVSLLQVFLITMRSHTSPTCWQRSTVASRFS